jgi:hypothetical protein
VKTGQVSLDRNGKSVGAAPVKAGRYRLTVTDGTATGSFELARLHKAPLALTTAPFVGKWTATVSLTPGRWFFYSGAGPKRTFFVVA